MRLKERKMKSDSLTPSEVRLVSTIPMPEHLFVCLAKIKTEAGATLKAVYKGGKKQLGISGEVFSQHLVYIYNLGEKGLFWEAGPATDFTEILYIFSTSSLAEARRLMHDDPFYREGIFFDDWWFEWHVHVPVWKIKTADREMMEGLMRHVNILPTYPPGVKPQITEIKVETVTPLRLFVSLSKARAESIKKLERDEQAGRPVPAFLVNHAYNRLGPGGTVQMGYDWEAGPSMDQSYDLTIMSVGSMQMAQQLRENDPVSQNGLFYDHRYFEWCILTPFGKVSPGYRDVMKELLTGAGIKPS
jgi:uncharacterized protein YciI